MTTMTRPTGVKCGNHPQTTYHANVAEVRACFADSAWKRQRPSAAEARIEAALDAFDPQRIEAEMDAIVQEGEREEDEMVAREDQQVWFGSGPPVTEDGVYRNPNTGKIFKVYHTVHGANQLVAKELILAPESEWYTKKVRGKETTIKAEFVYRGKAGLRGLTADMRMTLEEGKKYGAIYGVCIRCAATLTKELSIERAMGDVCAGKANWA